MRRLASLACAAALLAGCTLPTGPTDTENTAPPVNALDDPSHPGIEACASGNVEAELQIARDFEDSCHEMVICGGLSMAFTIALVEVLVNAATGDPTQPSGFVYTGGGRYLAGSQMEIALKLGKDTSFGKAGGAIEFDVFNLASYFESATIEATASVNTSGETKTSLSIQFTGTGPGYELLGLEADASGSISTDLETIAKNLGENVLLETRIFIDDERASSSVRYELFSPSTKLGVYFSSGPMNMDLVEVSGSSAATGQVISVSNWGMQYKSTSSSGTLDGNIDLTVTGGAFDYTVKYVYPHRKEPDVALACAKTAQ